MSRAVKLAGAAAPALALAEIAARALIRRRGGYYRYVPNWRVAYAINREALPQLPSVSYTFVNADGERGGPAPRAGEHVYRVLVVGGSAAECALLDQPDTWPVVVERILSEPDNARALGAPRAHVGSVARAILPCELIDVLLRRVLPRYERLDLVLIMVGGADAVSWTERGMPRELGGRVIDPSKIFEQHPEGPWGSSPRSTALWRIASGIRRSVSAPLAHEPGGDWMLRVRRMRAAATTWIDEIPDATPMLDHFETHLAALLGTARRAASRVILVRQPWWGELGPEGERLRWNFGLGRPYREEVKAYLTSRVADALMGMVDERAALVADRLGVEHVDLMKDLERSTATFYDELHFTPRGAEAVGRLVAAAILRGAKGAKKPAPRPSEEPR